MDILLVEDNPENQMLIKIYLKSESIALDFADNGKKALEQIKEKKYDLIFMDMQMPVMGGLSATRHIRDWERSENRDATPIIALTANAFDDDINDAIEAGCTAYLHKPIKKRDLLYTVKSFQNKIAANSGYDELAYSKSSKS